MIDISQVRQRVESVVSRFGGKVVHVGASELSGAIYINITKPKVVSAEYGVEETHNALVRVSNHFNDTNTHERLSADFFENIYEESGVECSIDELAAWLEQAETTKID